MSKLYDLLNILIGKVNKAVKTESQTLTDAQKTQARSNIGVDDVACVVYATCDTVAATAEKVVTVSGNNNWKLRVGSVILVYFSASNSASNVTLNVNRTGAYPIWYNNAEYTSTGTAYTGYAKRVIEYMFNGTHWVWMGASYDSNTTYKNVSLGHGYATCSTAAATAAKVGTLSSYALTVGGIVAVKFTNAVPANATLNINSKGAKNMFYRGAKITAGVIKAGDIATFIYDGTQYQLLSVDRWQNDVVALQNTLNGLSLGIHTDGLVYLFVDGSPVGTGIELPSGGIDGYIDSENNIVFRNLPDGTYTASYEDEDGSIVAMIGQLVKDTNVYYTVTKNLTNCTISNSATQAIGGKSYSATITAKSGYELKSVSVTMGGQSVSVSGGKISIANVTGNIVITAVAEEVQASYTNLAQPVGVGRVRGTGAIDSTATSARYTAPIPFSQGDTIRVKGLDLSTYNLAVYNDDAGTTLNNLGSAPISSWSQVFPYTLNGDTYTITVGSHSNLNVAKTIRFSGTLMSGFTEEDVVVTVNEEIN